VLDGFRSPGNRPLTGVQDYFNRKGLISDQGEKKLRILSIAERHTKERQ